MTLVKGCREHSLEKAAAALQARLTREQSARGEAQSEQGEPLSRLSSGVLHRPLSRREGECSADCPVCGGLGLVRYEAPLEDFRFGKLFPCPNLPPERLHEEGRYGLYWDEQRNLSWESVLEINGVEAALGATREAVERGCGWVYLWGGYGTAKTLLLKVAVAETLRAQRHAVYARMVDLLDDLRAVYDEDKAGSALVARITHYTGLPLLALDEIDRVKETEWARERIFQLVDRRYTAAELGRGVTLIASNSSPEALDGYLRSRVLDGRFAVVHMGEVDLRPALE